MADWWEKTKDLVGEFAPDVAAAVLPPPAGAIARRVLASVLGGDENDPQALAEAVANATPEQKIAIIHEGNRHKEALLAEANRHEESLAATDQAVVAGVNATMQVEYQTSAALTWWQKGWRPACGYALALGSFLSVLFVCWLFYSALQMPDVGSIAQVVSVLPSLALSIAAILTPAGAAVGVAAWQRGQLQREVYSGSPQQLLDGVVGLVKQAKK